MADLNKYPFWTARFWHGMPTEVWLPLIFRNRLQIHPLRWPMAGIVSFASLINTTGGLFQQLLYGRRIRDTEVTRPPLFVVGHWRSGTTMLHELLVCDQRFSYPTTYECIAPSHFLVSEAWLSRLLWFMVPRQRPMDNMKAGMKLPQEDEFALMNLGAPSPYLRMAFPNRGPVCMEMLDMQGVDPHQQRLWERKLLGFAKALTVRDDKQLVFKSPPHTGRLEVLAKLFPGAKFVHISRHPYSLFASTVRLWRALDTLQALQLPRQTESEQHEYVLESLERMYEGYFRQRETLDQRQLYEVRYEDLTERPLETMEAIYQRLELPDFEVARPSVTAYLDQRRDYQPTSHPELAPELRETIARRWASYIEAGGYDM